MANTINVRLPERLQAFIKAQTGGDGIYDSTSEYVRDLIRRDYERIEEQKWQKLEGVLLPGLEAEEDAFEDVSPAEVIAAAKARRHGG